MSEKKILIFLVLFFSFIGNSFSIEPDVFVQSTVNRASKLLAEDLPKNAKIEKLKFLSIYLVLLSIILEILHYFIPERSFEFPDLFGNLIGVIIVIIIFYFYKKNENFKN